MSSRMSKRLLICTGGVHSLVQSLGLSSLGASTEKEEELLVMHPGGKARRGSGQRRARAKSMLQV